MHKKYSDAINSTHVESLYTVSHKQVGAYPTGFVVIYMEPVEEFPFTVCPLYFSSQEKETVPGTNPHDVLVLYKKEYGSLESVLYTLYERYKETSCIRTEYSVKRFLFENKIPPRKIVIPCFKRKENLVPVLKRFQMIDLPKEGYRPSILLVEHSPIPELQEIAEEFQCEYIWIFLQPQNPYMQLGQFNKALCYDKAFLFGMPAEWYLFHDNDILVPKNFWDMLDQNVKRAKTQFIQPYTHRCLLNLKPAVAEMFREDLTLADQPLDESMYNDLTISTGAPGGSLYLTRQRYFDAGGHDPQFCWGYGPEDALFYQKLELLEPIAFADDPPIELIHLWHPPAQVTNPFRIQMDMFVKSFFKQRPEEWKRGYMEYKQEILKNLMQNFLR